jgi:hypothetical protein
VGVGLSAYFAGHAIGFGGHARSPALLSATTRRASVLSSRADQRFEALERAGNSPSTAHRAH